MESTRLQFWRSSFLVAVVIVYNICCRNFEEENAPCFFQARPHHRLQVDGDGAQVTNYWILPLSLTVSSPLLCGLLLTRCLHLFNIVPKEADLLRSSMTAWNELTKANRFKKKKKKKKRDKTQTLKTKCFHEADVGCRRCFRNVAAARRRDVFPRSSDTFLLRNELIKTEFQRGVFRSSRKLRERGISVIWRWIGRQAPRTRWIRSERAVERRTRR